MSCSSEPWRLQIVFTLPLTEECVFLYSKICFASKKTFDICHWTVLYRRILVSFSEFSSSDAFSIIFWALRKHSFSHNSVNFEQTIIFLHQNAFIKNGPSTYVLREKKKKHIFIKDKYHDKIPKRLKRYKKQKKLEILAFQIYSFLVHLVLSSPVK